MTRSQQNEDTYLELCGRNFTSQTLPTDEERLLVFKLWIQHPNEFQRIKGIVNGLGISPPKYNVLLQSLLWTDARNQPFTFEAVSAACQEVMLNSIAMDSGHPLARSVDCSVGGELHQMFTSTMTDDELNYAKDAANRFLMAEALYAPARQYLTRVSETFGIPSNIGSFLKKFEEVRHQINSISFGEVRSVSERWNEHEERIEQLRADGRIGIRTGYSMLDAFTGGLRCLTIIGAGPGVGKTAMCLQMCHDAVCIDEQSDTVAVFVSLELSADSLLTRLKSLLTQRSWTSYVTGVSERTGQRIDAAEQRSRSDYAMRQLEQSARGERLALVDRSMLPQGVTVESIRDLVDQLKRRTNSTRALIVIDYLQLIHVPDAIAKRGERESEKHQVRVVQDIVERGKSSENHFGDSVVVISEARKPTTQNRQAGEYGSGIADLMGSARLGYGADLVLTLRNMSKGQIEDYYQLNGVDGEHHRELLDQDSKTPLLLEIVKGRDGMRRGKIPLEFQFTRSTINEIRNGRAVPSHLRQQPLSREVLRHMPPQDSEGAA